MSNSYNPSKRYSWTPEDKFELTGDQFGIILNAVRGIMGTPETQRILALEKANNVFENLMAKAVEDGVVLEIPDQGKMEAQLKVVK
jgi:hypothetical protein